jgi:hypothetical protein
LIKCIHTCRLRTYSTTPSSERPRVCLYPSEWSVLKKIASDQVPSIARTHRYGQPCQLLFTLICRRRLQECFGTQPLAIPEIVIVTQPSSLEISECPLPALRSSLIGVVMNESSSSAFGMMCSLLISVAFVVVTSAYQHLSNVWCYEPHDTCTVDA